MRTEIQKQFLRNNGINEDTEGKLIDNLFTYPMFKNFELRELEKAGVTPSSKLNTIKEENQKMQKDDYNEAMKENTNTQVAQAPAMAQEPMQQQPVATPEPQPQQEVAQQPQQAQTAKAQQQPSIFDKLDNSREIEKQQFDPSQYIGRHSNIEFIEERHGQYGYYIKIFSQVIDEGDWEIRASAIYGLVEDSNGILGWPPESKLFNYLKKMGVAHYKDLLLNPTTTVLKDDKGEQFRRISGGIKTPIIIKTRDAKDGKEYLTF